MESWPTDILEPPEELYEAAPPSEAMLLEWLRQKVSKVMIEEVSVNDRGEDAAEHFKGIAAQLYQGEPQLGLIPWHPREVLELERWQEPDRAYVNEPPSGQRGHTKRLLACAILLRNVGHLASPQRHSEEEFFIETSAATLLRLTETAITIGGELPFSAVQFLLWLYRAQPYPMLRAFTAFGVLLLAAHESRGGDERFRDVNAAELCEWCIGVEKQCRTAIGPRVSSESWLIGLSSYEDREGHREGWKKLADSVLGASDALDSTQTVFAELARRLAKQ
jgi:hypothetical protein